MAFGFCLFRWKRHITFSMIQVEVICFYLFIYYFDKMNKLHQMSSKRRVNISVCLCSHFIWTGVQTHFRIKNTNTLYRGLGVNNQVVVSYFYFIMLIKLLKKYIFYIFLNFLKLIFSFFLRCLIKIIKIYYCILFFWLLTYKARWVT